jgi:signal transduction histidine kinase
MSVSRFGGRIMDFTAVAHDLRTPLNVMLGHMQLLADERLSETARHRLGVLEAQIRRMMRLLDSCSGQRHNVAHLAPVDLGVMIRNVVAELDAMLERRGIETRLTIRGLLPCVSGDGDLLHRVLLNVLVNAADSMPQGGRIEIGAYAKYAPNAPAGTVHIQIADNGGGIPSDLIARVFDRGFTTKIGGETHGYGLSICREIIQMHDGEIQLASAPGQGTTVHLALPITKHFRQHASARVHSA